MLGGREERLGYGGKVGGRQGWGSEGRLGGGRDGEVREGRWSEGGIGGGEGGNVGCCRKGWWKEEIWWEEW